MIAEADAGLATNESHYSAWSRIVRYRGMSGTSASTTLMHPEGLSIISHENMATGNGIKEGPYGIG
jgi:hypothetical protein